MKIVIQAPMKGEEIRALLDGFTGDGGQFTFVEKRGISLVFEVQGMDGAAACAVAKREIKAADWGKVLYFSVQTQ